jgi:hypothetical protein
MLDSTNDKMKCWGCKLDKPKSDFDKNPALCRRCVGATVVTRGKKSRSSGSGNWLDGIADAVGDFIGDLLS